MDVLMTEELFRDYCQELRSAIEINAPNIEIIGMGSADYNIFCIACDIINESEGEIDK